MAAPDFNDRKIQRVVSLEIRRIDEIIATGIFEKTRVEEPLFMSAFLECIMHLNDLLQKYKFISRIDWRDDVPQNLVFDKGDRQCDITNFVRWMRNAFGHVDSEMPTFSDFGWVHYFKGAGQRGLVLMGPKQVKSIYDETWIWVGESVFYLEHHMIRAFNEVKAGFIANNPGVYD